MSESLTHYIDRCMYYSRQESNTDSETQKQYYKTKYDQYLATVNRILNNQPVPLSQSRISHTMSVARAERALQASLGIPRQPYVISRPERQAPLAPKEPSISMREMLEGKGIDIPHEYICPITMEVMKEPVILSDGHVYEKEAIEAWFQTKNKSPLTNCLVDKKMTPCHALRNLIQAFIKNATKEAKDASSIPKEKEETKDTKSKKENNKKAPKVPRIPSEYNKYVKEKFPAFKEAHPELQFVDIVRLIAQEWKSRNE